MSEIQASVIIPTFNRKNTLRLSLLAFNKQDIDPQSFEVIVIDDASTDGTQEMIDVLPLKFPVYVLRNEVNQGAAAARNLGLNKANGEIIIFSDSDMLVPANFVRGHIQYHSEDKNLAVCCVFRWRRIFTFFYAGFNKTQNQEFCEQSESNPFLQRRLAEIDFQYDDGTAIFREDDAMEECSYIPPWSEEYLGAIVTQYGFDLQGFAFPWVLFGTGNSSVRKEHLLKIGGFDEIFLREEDWELGYRLYKAGLGFKCALEMESAHQEHPILKERPERMYKGYRNFFAKHAEPLVWLMALHLDNSFNWAVLSEGYKQYQSLKSSGTLDVPIIEKFAQLAKLRADAFVCKKQKTAKFMNLSYELGMLKPYSASHREFIQLYQELGRKMVVV